MILLLADTQIWLNGLCKQAVNELHPWGVRFMMGANYRLSITALAHIIERHYYKIQRHPGAGKFTIEITSVFDHLKTAMTIEPTRMKDGSNLRRILRLDTPIGFNKFGFEAYSMVVITDQQGAIITAYPE